MRFQCKYPHRVSLAADKAWQNDVCTFPSDSVLLMFTSSTVQQFVCSFLDTNLFLTSFVSTFVKIVEQFETQVGDYGCN